MPKLRIEYDRNNCIGAFACTAADPKRWIANANEGKADLIDGKSEGEKFFLELECSSEEKDTILTAAQGCPVNVIKVIDKESGKQLC